MRIMSGKTFRVCTLNVWALPLPDCFRHKQRFRVEKLIEALSVVEYDVITLQELWCESDYLRIVGTAAIKAQFPYAHYFHSGLLGSGICVLSKHRIKSTLMHRYSLNGYPHHFHTGDWFGGKIVGMLKIEYNSNVVALYVTHLHAEYDTINDIYLSHRVAQCFEMAMFIQETSSNADFVILAGDFNLEPKTDCYKLIKSVACLKDAWEEWEKMCRLNSNNLIAGSGMTCERPDNSFRPPRPLDLFRPESEYGKRLDYIMFKNGRSELELTECKLCFETIPNSTVNFSDHSGVEATFEVRESQLETASTSSQITSDEKILLNNMLTIIDNRESLGVQIDKKKYICLCISLILLLVASYFIPSDDNIFWLWMVLKILQWVCMLGSSFLLFFSAWYWLIGIRLEVKALRETKYSMRKLLKLPSGGSQDLNGSVQNF